VILDTNAVTALLAGDPALARCLDGEERHQLPVVVLGEYRYGLLGSRTRGTLGRLMDLLEEQSDVLEVDRETARHYAMARYRLKQVGRPIPENDLWIAALGLQHHLPIVSRDSHFDHIPGVRRVDW
jgi:predicted nucleic acid-binding protein